MSHASPELCAQYAAALRDYVETQAESPLEHAYEIGRRAMADGLGVVDVAMMQQEPLKELLGTVDPSADPSGPAARAAEFLAECLSPFEMALRGFRDANRQLEAEVAERRRAEAEVRLLNEDLERRVAERTAALEAADRQKDRFLAVLGHELRNPLAVIDGATRLLRSRLPNDPAVERTRDVLDRQLHLMSRLLGDLLDVSRIAHGKLELQRERVDVASVVSQAVRVTSPRMEARRHQLSVSLPPGPLWVDGDPARLEQILTNLLDNAAKYTPDGGLIDVSAACVGDAVVLRVRDNGTGIPAAVLPRVFDSFVQADRPLERTQGGLGLGLSLVRSLAELHGGSAEAHSEGPGTGSEFVVRIPAVAAQPAETGSGVAADAPARPRRILVVDDNVDLADMLATLLGMAGHEVHLAHTGSLALEVAEALRPDVVLLDLSLPDISGCEVASRLRQHPGLGKPLLVAMSGYGRDEDRRRCREAGFDEHLTKPIDMDRLACLLDVAPAEP